MNEERVYTVTGPTAEPATPITLAEAGLKERSDLQEWVIAHPEILGPGIRVVTTEFDRWQTASGDRPLDRLDVLGIDTEGRLVVAELKRDRATETVEMQAIKYAAFSSRFTPDYLVRQFRRHLNRSASPAEAIDEDAARELLVEHCGEIDSETLRKPRIVLVAGSFPASVTAAVVWLHEMGLKISLQRIQAYRTNDGKVIVSVSQLFPLANIEDFMISPAQVEADKSLRRRRERSAIVRLVEADEILDGTQLALRIPVEVPDDDRLAIMSWVDEDPQGKRGMAVWRNSRQRPLEWQADGKGYRPTALVREVLSRVDLDDRPISGSAWWSLPDGRNLLDVANSVAGGFDWSTLHALLEAVPPGRWTTYGDLATAVRTAAVPLGQHLKSCPSCTNAWRVLGSGGRPREGFRWGDATKTVSQQDVLVEEGVVFKNGGADESQKISDKELSALVSALA